ncbi:hypothetical protein MGG_09890 [Pyricularia oryzae 70-15]|uniref:Tubulin-specific chaperone A n=3 Tax=Pyricularia oryzae TaxID=318829 RepID=G4MR39_PYRO7|nr:uncharacterized protein MGG_09890 [Pyricularia oryzae 70-15]EHA57371.1 hypothetical protein MGG_09890 [Pyricularia oryzae 70-15]ELQ36665.1 hypothetical protein OOU_Y34scaffold00648g12 [Pyricularia oryzae Y34]KAI7928589.1 hypothetical protein M9X92_001677 [Pyricularia oryzae]KAI7928729.1 hypothetical protein M0657_002553 [Pyricularia oryzae]
MAPSQLSIATGSVSRLVKEESYYRKELSQQKEKLAKEKQSLGPDADYNDNFMIKQMETAIHETERVFAPLRVKIDEAVRKLEEQLALSESNEHTSEEELKKANDALESAKKLQGDAEAAE